MAKRPKPVRSEVKAESSLLQALQFCSLVTKKEGPPAETHILLFNHQAIAFNSILAVGHAIVEDLSCSPNAELITNALSKCGDQFSITQLDINKLSIKAGKFKAIVPCIDPTLIYPAAPDPNIAALDDRFKEAMEAVCVLASETAQSVVAASVLMARASLIATDRKSMMEYWHGLDLPTGIALPKVLGAVLSKIKKPLKGFGYSQSSVTFHYDNCWLRSQFYAEPWPDIRNILDRKCNLWPLPNDFYKALDAVESFSQDEAVYFDNGIIRSHKDENIGACHEVFSLPAGLSFSIKQLNIIRPYVEQVDFMAEGPHKGSTMLMWMGKNCRGAVMGRS